MHLSLHGSDTAGRFPTYTFRIAMDEKPNGRLATALCLVAIVATLARIYFKWNASHEREARVVAMAAEGRTLLAAAGAPPDAKPHDELWSRQNGSSTVTIIMLRQEYDRPGAFADTAEWYQRELPRRGFQAVHDEYESDTHLSFCSGAWSLTVTRTRNFERELPPEHRFQLDLSWWSNQPSGCSQS
jgi:hypothetical protein